MSESGSRRPARPVRWILWALLVIAAVWVLFEFIFPWVESRWYNPTLGLVTSLDGIIS